MVLYTIRLFNPFTAIIIEIYRLHIVWGGGEFSRGTPSFTAINNNPCYSILVSVRQSTPLVTGGYITEIMVSYNFVHMK